jgi:DNA-directed RNA polymerase alpha subunit
MTKEELLDHFATNAMTAQIQKNGLMDRFSLANSSFRMAVAMIEAREQIHKEWAEEEKREERYKSADLIQLNLPVRYYRCLVAEDIQSKQELCAWTERDLKRIPNLGMKGVGFIKQAMAEHGLKLKGQE